MTDKSNSLDSIRVLVSLSNPDRGTELAHALREEGLDVLVAHRIRSAMRVMERESPQAVVVEVATEAYDGFRVAQWASGRIMAIFLVAGRELTLMEDVEVLKAGAKEVFYMPVQAATIAASIRGACGADTRAALGPEASEPKTQYSAPPSVMAPRTVRRGVDLEPDGRSDTLQSTAVSPEDLAARSYLDAAAEAMNLAIGPTTRVPIVDMVLPGPNDVLSKPSAPQHEFPETTEEVETLPPDDMAGTGNDTTSSSLVADLFGDPGTGSPEAAHDMDPLLDGPPAQARPSARAIERPPDDDLLIAGMADSLDDVMGDSLYASEPSPDSMAEPDGTSEAAEDEESPDESTVEVDEQSSATAVPDGPLTEDIIALAYGSSRAPMWAWRGLLVAVICASGWLGWLVFERVAPSSPSESSDTSEATPEDKEAADNMKKLHATLGEAAVSHRDGDLDTAKAEYEEALKQEADNVVACRGLAAIAMSGQNWNDAREVLDRLAETRPDDLAVSLQRGLVLQELGQREPAKEELRRFIDAVDPEDPRMKQAARLYLSLTSGD